MGKESPAGAGDSFFGQTRTKRSHSQLKSVKELDEYQIRLTKYECDNMIKTIHIRYTSNAKDTRRKLA